ncbi:uncharacterized protein LOC110859290 [Folsomia candida]|uniref:uncharacterized protein LOC110859290 n=1 Tax=Folsomia candida TaxID=158441 RepID=UPI000B8F0956|nr:uncharacterized protein LOC110859290 [Folsomia candida]
MESELAKFRRRKELERTKDEMKEKVHGVWSSFSQRLTNAVLPSADTAGEEYRGDEDDGMEEDHISPPFQWLRRLCLGLTWLLFFVAFLKLEFGAVFFTASLLALIYWNTRTGGRRSGEISAYSVFNKGCESIDGTLKSEHLEKQLLYRAS